MKSKKVISFLVISILLVFTIVIIYSKSYKFNDLVGIDNNANVFKLEINELFQNNSKSCTISDPVKISEILLGLNKAILIPSNKNERSYKNDESYEIEVYMSENYYKLIRVYGNKYIGIDGEVYRSIIKSDLSSIQECLIKQ